MKFLLGLLLFLAAVAGIFQYNSKSAKPIQPPAAGEAAVTEIKVIGQNFRFDPAEITVKKGAQVRVILTSMDMPHDFDVDELGVDGPVTLPGETATVEFAATTAGEFEYYCSVGQHRAKGMVGKLIVTE